MRKIYTRTVFEYNPKTGLYETNENESQFHFIDDDAPVALAKGVGEAYKNSEVEPVKDYVSVEEAPFKFLGKLFSGGGGGDKDTSGPWSAQIPYLKEGFANAEKAYLNPNDAGQEGIAGILNQARTGSPLSGDAINYIDDTLKGKYLYGGAGFNAALDAAKNSILPQIQSGFESRGRTGGGLEGEAESSAIGDAFAKQYEQERALQQGAALAAPDIDKSRYLDSSMMVGAGQTERDWAKEFLQAIGGQYGTSVPQQALWKRLLEGGLGGAAAGSSLGPWGAAAGAGVGMLGAS